MSDFIKDNSPKTELNKPIIADDINFENNCYSLILENKLDEAYKMVCQYEQNRQYSRGINHNWNNPPEKKFRININKSLPFNIPNCIKPFEKEIKAITIYITIMGSNPKNAVKLFCKKINADVNKNVLKKTFIFLCAYENWTKELDYSYIENLEQEQHRIDNRLPKVFKNLSIEDFINAINNKFTSNGLNINNLQYDVLKDGTYNFTYEACQIGRIKIGKRGSKMQIITKSMPIWLENLSMEEYIANIDK